MQKKIRKTYVWVGLNHRGRQSHVCRGRGTAKHAPADFILSDITGSWHAQFHWLKLFVAIRASGTPEIPSQQQQRVAQKHRRFHGLPYMVKGEVRLGASLSLGSKTRRLGGKDPGKQGSGCTACEAVFASTAQTFVATSGFIMC